jgi:hypothetical protein
VYFFQENGILAVQAVADILSLVMAVPIAIMVTREVKAARQKLEKETELST